MSPKYPRITVQLTGQDDNAFMVLGLWQRAARQAGRFYQRVFEMPIRRHLGILAVDRVFRRCWRRIAFVSSVLRATSLRPAMLR